MPLMAFNVSCLIPIEMQDDTALDVYLNPNPKLSCPKPFELRRNLLSSTVTCTVFDKIHQTIIFPSYLCPGSPDSEASDSHQPHLQSALVLVTGQRVPGLASLEVVTRFAVIKRHPGITTLHVHMYDPCSQRCDRGTPTRDAYRSGP